MAAGGDAAPASWRRQMEEFHPSPSLVLAPADATTRTVQYVLNPAAGRDRPPGSINQSDTLTDQGVRRTGLARAGSSAGDGDGDGGSATWNLAGRCGAWQLTYAARSFFKSNSNGATHFIRRRLFGSVRTQKAAQRADPNGHVFA